jgi:REP element-mobilizing transposase RayT
MRPERAIERELTITSKYSVILIVSQSLSHLVVHSIFSTKDRRPFLRSEEIRNEIYAYIAGILKNLQCHPIKIGGMEDHVHILSSLSKNIALSDFMGRVKGSSSKRLKEKGVYGFWMAKWLRRLFGQRIERSSCHRLH